MVEQEQTGKPNHTEDLLNILEEAADHNPLQWRILKGYISPREDATKEEKRATEIWQNNLRNAGVDLDRVQERIREIDFEKRGVREFYEENNGLGRITRSRRIR